MYSDLTFDELNKLVGNRRYVDYGEYFGEMHLPEEKKRERTRFALIIEDYMLALMVYALTLEQYERLDKSALYDECHRQFEQAFEDAGIPIDSYVLDHIDKAATNFAEATAEHAGDMYYFSADRARFMSECEANSLGNYLDFADAENEGAALKTWHAIDDKRTRDTHYAVSGTQIPFTSLFEVGGFLMRFPMDTEYGAPPEEIVNCRCSLSYE